MKPRPRTRTWLLGILALALAALACDPYPITGITCLQKQTDGTILAQEERSWFISKDGGLSWHDNGPKDTDAMVGCARFYSTPQSWTLSDPTDHNVMYRFNPETSIERSADAGVNWHREVDLSGTEARTVYYLSVRRDGFDFRSGPLDALIDPDTGNLIVAMGYEGVLVRTPQARWSWVPVGMYSRVDMRDLSISLPLIAEEILLALLFGLMTLCSLPVLSVRKSFWWVWAALFASLLYMVLVLGGAFLLGAAITTTVRDWQVSQAITDALAPFTSTMLPGAILIGAPLVSWLVARRSHQEKKLAFVWSSIGWLLLALNAIRIAVFRISEFSTPIPTFILAPVMLAISGLVLVRSKFERRELIASLAFGLTTAAAIIACYFLWAIGGISHHTTASLWAGGLAIFVIAMGVRNVAHVANRATLPSQRDMPPESAQA